MPVLTWNASQGKVTARDPSALQIGELVSARQCEYRLGSEDLFKLPGRLDVTSSAITGDAKVRGIKLFEYTGGVYKVIVVSGTGVHESDPHATALDFGGAATLTFERDTYN